MAAHYFGAKYFAAGFYGGSAERGGYYGAGYFGANYFRAGFYGPITIIAGDIHATLDVTEAADTLEATATVSNAIFGGGAFFRPSHRPPRLEPIHVRLDVREKPDTCEATVTLGFDPVEMDNNLLLIAA